MKIDFRKIEVEDIEGKKSTVDVSKVLGNTIYKHTTDLGELEFAQEIYKQGEVEVDAQKSEIVKKYLDVGQFLAYVKISVLRKMETIKE